MASWWPLHPLLLHGIACCSCRNSTELPSFTRLRVTWRGMGPNLPLGQGRLEPVAEERGSQVQSPTVAGSQAVPDAWRFFLTAPEKTLELSLFEVIFKWIVQVGGTCCWCWSRFVPRSF